MTGCGLSLHLDQKSWQLCLHVSLVSYSVAGVRLTATNLALLVTGVILLSVAIVIILILMTALKKGMYLLNFIVHANYSPYHRRRKQGGEGGSRPPRFLVLLHY